MYPNLNLSQIQKRLDSLCEILFANGYFFLVPYLCFYLYFKQFHGETYLLRIRFISFHFCNILLFSYYLYNVSKRIRRADFLFWTAVILLFLIPGAYLEFPSDAWEHFRRIFTWQTSIFVDDNPINYKFTYFWGWTLMSEVEPLYRRTALNIYSTFWQFLLAYQFYLFALRIGFSESWAKVQVVGTICLFGTNVFSFYRYYALSSTPLAYIAYLQALIVIIDICEGKRNKATALIFLIPLIYYNHYQELLFLVVSTIGIVTSKLYGTAKPRLRKKINYIVIITLPLCFVCGAFAVKYFEYYAYFINQFWQLYLKNYFQEKSIQNWAIDPIYWSKWGILRIWDMNLPYFQTLGVCGFISIFFSLIFWKKYNLLSIITLVPILILIFQPFTLFIIAIDDSYTTFRILYAFPYSFMFVVGLKEMAELVTNKLIKKPLAYNNYYINKYCIIGFLVIVLSLQPSLPWRGRFWFQLYQPQTQLSLKNLDITAQWLFKNRQLKSICSLETDISTGFIVATHFNFYGLWPYNRLSVYNPSQNIKTLEQLKKYLESEMGKSICSFLVGIPGKMVPPPISKVGQLSGHWKPDTVRQNLNYSQEFVDTLAVLKAQGWTQTFVPPFYWLYEAPWNK